MRYLKQKVSLLVLLISFMLISFYHIKADTNEYVISGRVFRDCNYNSLMDDNSYFSNVKVDLIDISNNVVETTMTNDQGVYEFNLIKDNFVNKSFKLRFNMNDKYTYANYHEGSNASIYSDVNDNFETNDFVLNDGTFYNFNAGFAKKLKVSKFDSDLKIKLNNEELRNISIDFGNFVDYCLINNNIVSVNHFVTSNILTMDFNALNIGKTDVGIIVKDNYQRVSPCLKVGSVKVYEPKTITGKILFVDNSLNEVNSFELVYPIYTVVLRDSSNNILRVTQSNHIGKFTFNDLDLDINTQYNILIHNDNNIFSFKYKDANDSYNAYAPTQRPIIIEEESANVDTQLFYVTDEVKPEIVVNSNAYTNKNYNPTVLKANLISNSPSVAEYLLYKDDIIIEKANSIEKIKIPNDDGHYRIEYFVKNLANIKSNLKEYHFIIDKNAPNIDINMTKDINPSISDFNIKIND